MTPLRLCCLLSFVLSAGCFPPRQVISNQPEPRATVRAIRAQSFDRQHAVLSIEIEIENPGAELALTSADYEIVVLGHSFARGVNALWLAVPAGGRAELTLSVELAYLDLPEVARAELRRKSAVQIVVRGALHGGWGAATVAVELDGSAELAVTGDAELP